MAEYDPDFEAHCATHRLLLDAAVDLVIPRRAKAAERKIFRNAVCELASWHFGDQRKGPTFGDFRTVVRQAEVQSIRLRRTLVQLDGMLRPYDSFFFKGLTSSPTVEALINARFRGNELRAPRNSREGDWWKPDVGGQNGRRPGDEWFRGEILLHMNDSRTVQALRWVEEFCMLFARELKGRNGGPWTVDRAFRGHRTARIVKEAGLLLLHRYPSLVTAAKEGTFVSFCDAVCQFVRGEQHGMPTRGIQRYVNFAVPLLRRLWAIAPQGVALSDKQRREVDGLHMQLDHGPPSATPKSVRRRITAEKRATRRSTNS